MFIELHQLIPNEADLLNNFDFAKLANPAKSQEFYTDPVLAEIYEKSKKATKPPEMKFLYIPITIRIDSIVSVELSAQNSSLIIVELDSGRQLIVEHDYKAFTDFLKQSDIDANQIPKVFVTPLK